MLYGEKSRDDLNKYAEELFQTSEIVQVKKNRRKLYTDLFKWFNMPTSIAEEMITFKRDIKEFTPFDIFCILYFVDKNSLSKFFTENEIAKLSKEKYIIEKADFPLVFKDMVQITDDQWIGKTTVQELMKLKRSRMLNYDENEQRALRRVKSGKEEIFKPFVSNKNVREIKEAMENGVYIPDPITLNMPEGSEYSFSNNTLTIESMPNGMFNLDDGYHRYLAMSQIYDFNKDFDYPMELEIVNFSNTKANNFIFQKDQKTPMKKIVAATYNLNAIPNRIIQRINEDPTCNISHMIGRNQANIDAGVMSKLITTLFIPKDIKKDQEAKTIISIKNDLVKKFNKITEQDEKFLGKYSDQMLFATMYIFSTDINEGKYAEAVNDVLDSLTDEESKILNVSTTNTIRRKAISILEEKLAKWR